MRTIAMLALGMMACVNPEVTQCANGRICPADYACDEIHGLCVQPSQLTGCAAGDTTCTLPSGRTGSCDQGVCIEDVCGDGIVTGLEDCEPGDGRTFDCVADGGYYDARVLECSNRCVFEESQCSGTCGDGVINGPPGREVCEGTGAPPGTCLDYGFEAGRLACNASACGPDLLACRDIGFVPFTSGGQSFNAAYMATPTHVFLAEGNGVLEVDGSTQTHHPLPTTIFALWGTGPTDVYAVGGLSSIFHYDGATWTTELAPTSMGLFGVWGAGTDVYAVGTGNQIWKRAAGGTWALTPAGAAANWHAIWGTSSTAIRVVGDAGRIRKYDGTWSDENGSACWSSGSPDLTGVWSTSASDVFVVGDGGLICHFNGAAWSLQQAPGNVNLTAVWGRASDDVFAVGEGGAVFHYDGRIWRALDRDAPVNLTGVTGLGSDVAIVGVTGTARRYGGAAFATENLVSRVVAVSATAPALEYVAEFDYISKRGVNGWQHVLTSGGGWTALWVDAGGTVFAAGTNFIHKRSPTGVETSDSFVLFGVNGLDGRSPTDVFAVGDDDAGVASIAHYNGAWTPMTVSAPASSVFYDVRCAPTVTYAVGSKDGTDGIAFKYSSATGWTAMTVPAGTGPLNAVYPVSDTDVFAVGAGGTILHTTDGASWTTMDSGSQAELLDIRGTGPDDIFAGGLGTLLEFDGVGWLPVKVPLTAAGPLSVRDDAIFIGTDTDVTVLVRDATW